MVKELEKYSFSKLNSFETCPYGWYLKYIEGKPDTGSSFASYGTLIHSIMERFARGELKKEELVDVFEWEFPFALSGHKFPPNKYADLEMNYFLQGVEFLSSFEGFDGLKILGVEQEFDVQVDDWLLRGFIDLTYETADGQLVIRDWKSATKWSKKDLAEHARQLYLYSLWVKEKYGRFPDMLQFYHFRDHKTSDIPFNQNDFEKALDWARQTVDEIRNAWVYDAKPDYYWCHYICGARDNCEEKNANQR